MAAILIQVGNTDDKLPQARWAAFLSAMHRTIEAQSQQVHFFGTSPSHSKRQDASWVVEMENGSGAVDGLSTDLAAIRAVFHQDTVTMTIGKKRFV